MKVVLISLGCSKNLVDSEIMLGILKKSGFRIQNEPRGADIALVNTCAFVNDAKQEAIDEIFELVELKKKHKLKKIIVAGCLAQRYDQQLPELLKEVDGFIGPANIENIVNVIKKVFEDDKDVPSLIDKQNKYLYTHNTPRHSLTPKHFAYVKIAEGCDNWCSYCVIPHIRGSYRSRPIESIIKEVKSLVKKGVKEINLISQDSAFYGKDLYRAYSLDRLLERLVKIKDLHWIRILYSHPRHFNKKMIDVICRYPKICNYVDLPIQHISDRILKSMGRKVTASKIRQLIRKIRKKIPDAALRTSLIVGYPGETAAEFKQLCDFVKEVGFERLGVFTYSQEEDTKAAALGKQLPQNTKVQRYNKIMKIQQSIVDEKNQKLIGRELDVIIDEVPKKGMPLGRSQYDAPDVDGVIYVRSKKVSAGQIVKVKITESLIYDLVGERV